jgi:hypothetical protein
VRNDGYTAKSLQATGETTWVSRVPETFDSACEIIHAVAGELAEGGEETAWRTLCVTEAGASAGWSSTAAPPGAARKRP